MTKCAGCNKISRSEMDIPNGWWGLVYTIVSDSLNGAVDSDFECLICSPECAVPAMAAATSRHSVSAEKCESYDSDCAGCEKSTLSAFETAPVGWFWLNAEYGLDETVAEQDGDVFCSPSCTVEWLKKFWR